MNTAATFLIAVMSFDGSPSTTSTSACLPASRLPTSRIQAREQARKQWVDGALQTTQDCDVVFVDPDNGIGDTAKASSKNGAKYVLLEELSPYLDRDQTLVIYHHLNRLAPADTQIKERMVQARQSLGESLEIIASRYHRGSARVFFVVASFGRLDDLKRRAELLIQSPWSQHFSLISG